MSMKIEFVQPEYRRSMAVDVIPPQEQIEAVSDKVAKSSLVISNEEILEAMEAAYAKKHEEFYEDYRRKTGDILSLKGFAEK